MVEKICILIVNNVFDTFSLIVHQQGSQGQISCKGTVKWNCGNGNKKIRRKTHLILNIEITNIVISYNESFFQKINQCCLCVLLNFHRKLRSSFLPWYKVKHHRPNGAQFCASHYWWFRIENAPQRALSVYIILPLREIRWNSR